jgi:O-antigen ligase
VVSPYDAGVLVRTDPRSSASWYLGALAIGVVLERYVNYLWFEIPIVFGQPANVLSGFIYFLVATAIWLVLEPRARARSWLSAFLLMMAIAWLIHFVLYRYHGDAFNYTALLYIPILFLIWWKPPTTDEAWSAISVFAWTVSIVLVGTRTLESAGLLQVRSQTDALVAFDSERYLLPLNALLGIDGRWPGPFGHNSDTAMMGALLIVIALARWSRSSWVFLIVGATTLLVTSGRASIGAAAAGLLLMFMFRDGTFLWMTRFVRIPIGIVALALGAWTLVNQPAGLTGRNTIWPAFIELWQGSPWIGVGGSGISEGNEWAIFFQHAHNMYLDDLTREGLLGAGVQYAAVTLGVVIAARVAWWGAPGALAVIVTYLITGITEPRNPWIAPSATGFLFILMVVYASTFTPPTASRPTATPTARVSRG